MSMNEKQKIWATLSGKDDSILVNDYAENIQFKYRDKWYNRISIHYKTKGELLQGEKVLAEPCRECGGLVGTNYSGNEKMIERNLCFNCNFWTDILLDYNNERRYVVKSGMYYREDDAPHDYFQGFGGREFKIQRHGQSDIIITHNLWFNGEIPNKFLDRLKNNADFI